MEINSFIYVDNDKKAGKYLEVLNYDNTIDRDDMTYLLTNWVIRILPDNFTGDIGLRRKIKKMNLNKYIDLENLTFKFDEIKKVLDDKNIIFKIDMFPEQKNIDNYSDNFYKINKFISWKDTYFVPKLFINHKLIKSQPETPLSAIISMVLPYSTPNFDYIRGFLPDNNLESYEQFKLFVESKDIPFIEDNKSNIIYYTAFNKKCSDYILFVDDCYKILYDSRNGYIDLENFIYFYFLPVIYNINNELVKIRTESLKAYDNLDILFGKDVKNLIKSYFDYVKNIKNNINCLKNKILKKETLILANIWFDDIILLDDIHILQIKCDLHNMIERFSDKLTKIYLKWENNKYK
jgi:hypothetical protein